MCACNLSSSNCDPIKCKEEETNIMYESNKNDSSKAKLYWTVGIIIAVAVAALLIWHTFFYGTENGTAATVGDQEFSTVEVTYYYNTVANNYINQAQQYKAYGIDMGYDTDKSPAEQTYNEEEGTTYADYFLDQALTQLQRTAILCEEASKEGYTLSADGEKAVQDNMTALYTYSVQSGAGSEEAYLRAIYGNKMSKSLFKDLLTQAILADEYATHKSETFTYTDEQLNKYYNENKNDLDSYEYRYCYVNADFPEQETDADGNTVDLDRRAEADRHGRRQDQGRQHARRRPGRAPPSTPPPRTCWTRPLPSLTATPNTTTRTTWALP